MNRIALVLVAAAMFAAGCKKKVQPPVAAKPADPAAVADGGVVAPGPGGGVVVEQPPLAAGGGGGGGAVQAVRGAVKRIVTMHELTQIRTFIEFASGVSGKMPTPQETLASLQQEAPQIAKLVSDGTITIHAARTREDVWAYETAAVTAGGLVVTSQGVERMDAAVLKQKLGR